MDSFSVDTVDDLITEWYSNKFDELGTINFEFGEITKDLHQNTFTFGFKVGKNSFLFVYDQTFVFQIVEMEEDTDMDLIYRLNQIIKNSGATVYECLDHFLSAFRDLKNEKHNKQFDRVWYSSMKEGEEDEEENVSGWSDEEEEDEYKEDSNNPHLKEDQDHESSQALLSITKVFKQNVTISSEQAMKMFLRLKIFENANELKRLVEEDNIEILASSFRVQIFEPYLMVKFTVDLNYLSTPHTVYESLGFTMQELVEYLIVFDEAKLLLFEDDPSIYSKDLTELLNLGVVKIEFAQQNNDAGNDRYMSYLQMLHTSFFELEGEAGDTDGFQSCDNETVSLAKATLLEMGFEDSIAEKELRRNRYNLQNTINYLLMMRSKWEEEVKEYQEGLDIEDVDPKFMLFNNVITEQLLNNSLLHYFKHIICSLDSVLEYWWIWRDKLSTKSTKIRCCNKGLWEFSFEESQGIYIIPEIKNDLATFSLDLSIFSEWLMSNKANQWLKPFPSYFLKAINYKVKEDTFTAFGKKEIEDIKANNKDLNRMRSFFKMLPAPDKLIKDRQNDSDLVELFSKLPKVGHESLAIYKLLQYLVCTNRVSFKQLSDDGKLSGVDSFDEYIIYNNESNKEEAFQEMKRKKDSVWTFHGSSMENWYSILRNGPKNLFHTEMMADGVDSEDVVYLSSDFATASGYTRPRNNEFRLDSTIPSWEHSKVKSKRIVGVLEIIKNPSYGGNRNNNSWLADYSIFACPDDHWIMLRYIWVFSQNDMYKGRTARNNLTTNDIPFESQYYSTVREIQEEQMNHRKERLLEAHKRAKERYEEELELKKKIDLQVKEQHENDKAKEKEQQIDQRINTLESKMTGKGSAIATNRILEEYKFFQTSSDIKNFEIKLPNDNFYKWVVSLDILKFELTPELKEDFEWMKQQTGNGPELQFEIVYTSSFPFDPPFIRVVKPIFKVHTGHVTMGGSLWIESLTPSGWSSARSIEGIFVEILSIILQGETRIEKSSLGHTYSIQEARAAFERVAKHHGWL